MLIVSAHPYCTLQFTATLLRTQFTRNIMPHHALSAHAVEEMWRYIVLVGT